MDLGILSELESRLVSCARLGEELDCAPEGQVTPDSFSKVNDWDRREIRAEVLAALCTKEDEGRAHPRRRINLTGANVVGMVDLSGVHSPQQFLFFKSCRFADGINLSRAEIAALTTKSCEIKAIAASELTVNLTMDISNSHIGGLSLLHARIGNRLIGEKTILDAGEKTIPDAEDIALAGDGLIARDVIMRGVTSEGTVRFPYAQIDGVFDIQKANLTKPDGNALVLDAVSVGALQMSRIEAKGTISLQGAHIKYQLACEKGTLTGPVDPGTRNVGDPGSRGWGIALAGDGLRAGSVIMRGINARGELRVAFAKIDGVLDLGKGSKLLNPKARNLVADGLVAGHVVLKDVQAIGELRLTHARIDGRLVFDGGMLANEGGKALQAQECRASGALLFGLRKPVIGSVDLNHAEVGLLADDLASWPSSGLVLAGFKYLSLEGKDRDPIRRLEWIRHSEPFDPGVYSQLQGVYKRSGEDRHARMIAIARENDRRARAGLTPWSWMWNFFLGKTVAHGYRPWKAIIYLVALMVAGTILFYLPRAQHAMAPTDTDKRVSAATCSSSYPCFYPLVYTLDVLLPVIDFHQESKWLPAASHPYGHWYQALTWFLIAAGWLLTTAIVAGIGTVWRRD